MTARELFRNYDVVKDFSDFWLDWSDFPKDYVLGTYIKMNYLKYVVNLLPENKTGEEYKNCPDIFKYIDSEIPRIPSDETPTSYARTLLRALCHGVRVSEEYTGEEEWISRDNDNPEEDDFYYSTTDIYLYGKYWMPLKEVFGSFTGNKIEVRYSNNPRKEEVTRTFPGSILEFIHTPEVHQDDLLISIISYPENLEEQKKVWLSGVAEDDVEKENTGYVFNTREEYLQALESSPRMTARELLKDYEIDKEPVWRNIKSRYLLHLIKNLPENKPGDEEKFKPGQDLYNQVDRVMEKSISLTTEERRKDLAGTLLKVLSDFPTLISEDCSILGSEEIYLYEEYWYPLKNLFEGFTGSKLEVRYSDNPRREEVLEAFSGVDIDFIYDERVKKGGLVVSKVEEEKPGPIEIPENPLKQ